MHKDKNTGLQIALIGFYEKTAKPGPNLTNAVDAEAVDANHGGWSTALHLPNLTNAVPRHFYSPHFAHGTIQRQQKTRNVIGQFLSPSLLEIVRNACEQV